MIGNTEYRTRPLNSPYSWLGNAIFSGKVRSFHATSPHCYFCSDLDLPVHPPAGSLVPRDVCVSDQSFPRIRREIGSSVLIMADNDLSLKGRATSTISGNFISSHVPLNFRRGLPRLEYVLLGVLPGIDIRIPSIQEVYRHYDPGKDIVINAVTSIERKGNDKIAKCFYYVNARNTGRVLLDAFPKSIFRIERGKGVRVILVPNKDLIFELAPFFQNAGVRPIVMEDMSSK